MTNRYIKCIPTGVVFIYETNPAWIGHPDFEEVADAQGTPLAPAIEGEAVVVEEAPARRRRKAIAEEPAVDAEAALAADASRGLP